MPNNTTKIALPTITILQWLCIHLFYAGPCINLLFSNTKSKYTKYTLAKKFIAHFHQLVPIFCLRTICEALSMIDEIDINRVINQNLVNLTTHTTVKNFFFSIIAHMGIYSDFPSYRICMKTIYLIDNDILFLHLIFFRILTNSNKNYIYMKIISESESNHFK